jgi:hypothetical protein
VLIDERFEDGGELLLLSARELRSGFEKLFHLAGGPGGASLSSVRTYQIIH